MTRTFRRFFTEEEEVSLLRTVKRVDDILAKRDYYWMELLRATSMRVSTLAGLTMSDAIRAHGFNQLDLPAELLKGKKASHTIPLNRRSQSALTELRRINRKMLSGWDDRPSDPPLVLSRNHRALSVRSYQARMVYWCGQAGLSGGSPHWWRHTWAKRALKNSTNRDHALLSVQKILGHSDIHTTTIYTQPDKSDLEEIMRDSI